MSAMQTIALPRVYSDAVAVCANPKDYANRPTLMHLARLILISAAGRSLPQRTRETKPSLTARRTLPALRMIDGGRA